MKRLILIEQTILSIFLIIMTIGGFTQVLARYVFKIPLPWIEELIRYVMIWFTFISIGIAISKKTHLQIDLFSLLLPERVHAQMKKLVMFIMLLFLIAFTYISLDFVVQQFVSGQTSPAMRMPMVLVYASFVVGGFLAIYHNVYSIIKKFY